MINVDNERLTKNYDEIKSYLDFYYKLGQPLIDEYTKTLDEKVDKINTYLNQIKQHNLDFDLISLQKMSMELSSILYYTTSKLEQVELLANMAKISYKAKYNEVYTSKQEAVTQDKRKYTTDQLKATAEQAALEEELVSFIYDHVVTEIKAKVDAGYEVLKVVSKNLSAQIEAMKQYGYTKS